MEKKMTASEWGKWMAAQRKKPYYTFKENPGLASKAGGKGKKRAKAKESTDAAPEAEAEPEA